MLVVFPMHNTMVYSTSNFLTASTEETLLYTRKPHAKATMSDSEQSINSYSGDSAESKSQVAI